MPDDPRVLDLRADHEAGHVLQEDERHVERVADLDEVRRLVGRVVVEDAAEVHRLVGDDADALAADAREARDDAPGEARLDVEDVAVVHDRRGSSLYMSYGLRSTPGGGRAAPRRGGRSGRRTGTSGGGSSQFDGRNERYFFTAARHAASFSNSPSPTPLTSQWIFEPPSSCSAISCPVTALTSAGPPSASEPMPFTIGHVVGEARDVRRARRARARPSPRPAGRRRSSRPARGTGAPSPRRARSCPGGSTPGRCARPPESMSHTIGQRPLSAIERRRVTFSSPVYPMLPPLTVKSYAAQQTMRPSTLPKAVTTPSAGGLSVAVRPRREAHLRAVHADLEEDAVVEEAPPGARARSSCRARAASRSCRARPSRAPWRGAPRDPPPAHACSASVSLLLPVH